MDIWDPMYKAEFDGGWRAFEPILAASGGNLFTNERGEVAMHLHPTEWPKLPHQLHSSYRITCFVGTAMVRPSSCGACRTWHWDPRMQRVDVSGAVHPFVP